MADILGAMKQIGLAETYTDPADKIIKILDSFPITPSFGAVYYRSLDFGFPNVRDSVQDNPQADGTIDETQYTGARNVSIEGTVIGNAFGNDPAINGWPSDIQWNSASWFISLLSAWASPARRYRLYFQDEIGRSRFMDVRGASFTAQIEKFSDEKREFQLQMVNPSGKIYSFASGDETWPDGRYRRQIIMVPGEEDGRSYPLGGAPYNRTYPEGFDGYRDVPYGGTVPNGVLIEIYTGEAVMKGPRITFTAPNGQVSEIGLDVALEIPAGATLYIDTIARTVSYQTYSGGVFVNHPCAQYLKAPLQWPQLRTGIRQSDQTRGFNKVTFTTPVDGSFHETATTHVIYHEADLL